MCFPGCPYNRRKPHGIFCCNVRRGRVRIREGKVSDLYKYNEYHLSSPCQHLARKRSEACASFLGEQEVVGWQGCDVIRPNRVRRTPPDWATPRTVFCKAFAYSDELGEYTLVVGFLAGKQKTKSDQSRHKVARYVAQ